MSGDGPPDSFTYSESDGPTTAGPKAIREDLLEAFATSPPDLPFADQPSEAFLETEYFDLDDLADQSIVERYWVHEPYAQVAILHDAADERYRYHVIEPNLSSFETRVMADLKETIRRVLRNQPPDPDRSIPETIQSIIASHAIPVSDGSLHKIYYRIVRDFTGYDWIDPLMRDSRLEEISCDGADIPVFVYHQDYQDLETNLMAASSALDGYVRRLAQRTDATLSVADPLTSATLPDGSRVQLTLGSDIALRGSNFTIRLFKETPFTPVDLVATNTFSIQQMAYLWLAIASNKSIMFVGPTASGKTTSMNAVSLFLRPEAKVVSAEQVHELSIPHDNWIATVTREGLGESGPQRVTMYDLLQNALHQRPEYILVGEIRTEPEVVRTYFQSVFTGHPGGTTFHASTAQNAINRLMSEPLSIDEQLINALDLISVQHQVSLGDKERRLRRNMTLSEVQSSDDAQEISLVDLFRWDPATDSITPEVSSLLESSVIQDIAASRGWDDDRLLQDLANRRAVLEYLLDAEIRSYDTVVETFQRFARNQSAVLAAIRERRLTDDGFQPATDTGGADPELESGHIDDTSTP
ncbi:MAG: type II/IV secretion system ATPase subunit [Natrialbaceae archaeon]|nr:type II/IV secretion system ATPase subunit [Natrialbaceae archaeon]